MILIIAAAFLALLTCVPAYAAETISQLPGSTDISAYAKYEDNIGFTVIFTDENGNGSVTLPDGTDIAVSGADKKGARIIVEEVTDGEAFDWAKKQLGDKSDSAKIYYVCLLDENGLSKPTNGITVTVKPKNCNADSVYAVSDGKTGKLQSKAENGAFTFTTDGSSFYALCKVNPEDKPPQTGVNSDLALCIALLFISGGVIIAVAVSGKKKKHQE